jgi:hypothetical protein
MHSADYLAGRAEWRDPQIQTPPGGAKVLLLSSAGVCVVGTWAEWAMAWAPLPKMPDWLKDRVTKRWTGSQA